MHSGACCQAGADMTLGLETKQGFRPNRCAVQTCLGPTSYAESELSSANTMASQMSARSKVSARSRSSNLQHVSLMLIHRLLCSLYSTVIAPRCTQPSPEWPKEAPLQICSMSSSACCCAASTAFSSPQPAHGLFLATMRGAFATHSLPLARRREIGCRQAR